MLTLSGKHILVCGGSRGIGAETAKIAAQLGAKVTINYKSRTIDANEVKNAITAKKGQAQILAADLCDEIQVSGMIQKAIQQFGEIDGVVIAAGIFEGKAIEEMSVEFWDSIINANLKSTFLAVKHSVESIRKKNGGSIVIYSSTAGQRGSSIFSAYATSKGSQMLFMRSMAKELAKDKIRCNCVAPGWTETEMATAKINEFGRQSIVESIPLGRIGLPSDAANAAVFLLSDLAEFITGSTITVDGGADMRG